MLTVAFKTEELQILLKASKTSPSEPDTLASYGMISTQDSLHKHLTLLPHPSGEQGEFLCNLFFSRIEPSIRIVHETSFRKECQVFRMGKGTSPLEFEALLFAVYTLTVFLSPSEMVEHVFGESRSELLGRYKKAVEMALCRCQFMRSNSFISFQALLYWIVGFAPFPRQVSDRSLVSAMISIFLCV